MGGLNDAIDEALFSIKYTSFDSEADMVAKLSKGALLEKCNIKSAFWLLPVHSMDCDLLGFVFEGARW